MSCASSLDIYRVLKETSPLANTTLLNLNWTSHVSTNSFTAHTLHSLRKSIAQGNASSGVHLADTVFKNLGRVSFVRTTITIIVFVADAGIKDPSRSDHRSPFCILNLDMGLEEAEVPGCQTFMKIVWGQINVNFSCGSERFRISSSIAAVRDSEQGGKPAYLRRRTTDWRLNG